MHPGDGLDDHHQPLKILHLAARYSPRSAGGTETYKFRLGGALAERGHEFHVLSCAPDQQDEDYLDGPIRIHARSGLGLVERGGSVTAVPWTARRVYAALSHWREARRLGTRFDILESPDYGACGLLLAIKPAQAVVVRLHSPLALEAPFYSTTRPIDVRWSDRLERALVGRAHMLTAATRGMPEHLKAIGWLGEDEVRVVRNGTDFSVWDSAQPVQRTGPVVLAVGRVESRKAPEVLVRAIARLKERIPDVQAIFLGRSNGTHQGMAYRNWVIKLARQIAAPCQFLDEVTRDQLASLYGRARVVAIPSWQEGFSNAGLEAMASRRPVVCTSSTGLAELIQGTPAGTVVPPGDDALLAAALSPYLLSAHRASEAGCYGRRLAQAECSPQALARLTEECYYEAIRRWKHGGAAGRHSGKPMLVAPP